MRPRCVITLKATLPKLDPGHTKIDKTHVDLNKVFSYNISYFRRSTSCRSQRASVNQMSLARYKACRFTKRGQPRNTPHIPSHMFCSLLLRFVFPVSILSLRSYAAIGPKADLHIVNGRVAPDGFTRSYAPHSYTP